MATFSYPSNAELKEIEQDFLPRLMKDRPIFDILPIENEDTDLVMWEQEDNYIGLQQVRGLNGNPGRVNKVGIKRYIVQPGVYGEDTTINEMELTRRRQFGSFASSVDISDLVIREQNRLLQRRLDRIEYIGWTLLCTGTFSVSLPTGGVAHTDSFATQTFTASPLWSSTATATPLADLRTIQLLNRGHSVRFDSSSTLYANQQTVNNLLNNTNAADLGGKKLNYGSSLLDLRQLNDIYLGNGLPKIQVMDAGYYNDAGTFVLFIPNGQAVLVGSRTSGAPIGNYVMTRNANNESMAPGPYTRVIDKGEMQVPRLIEVHDGHSGSPALRLPSAVVSLTV